MPRIRIEEEDFRAAEKRIARDLGEALGLSPADLFVAVLPQTDGQLLGHLDETALVRYAEESMGV